jgi:hypothetical protein
MYACHINDSANFLDHYGALFVYCGALINLEKELQWLYENNSVKPALTQNLLNSSQPVDI